MITWMKMRNKGTFSPTEENKPMIKIMKSILMISKKKMNNLMEIMKKI